MSESKPLGNTCNIHPPYPTINPTDISNIFNDNSIRDTPETSPSGDIYTSTITQNDSTSTKSRSSISVELDENDQDHSSFRDLNFLSSYHDDTDHDFPYDNPHDDNEISITPQLSMAFTPSLPPNCNNLELTITYHNLSSTLYLPSTKGNTSPSDVENPIFSPIRMIKNAFDALLTNRPLTQPFHRLHSVSGSIIPGKTTLIIARPGSGRSTLLKLLSCTLPPTSGTLLFNGLTQDEAHTLEKCDVTKMLEFVEQDDTHFEMLTVYEILEFAFTLSQVDQFDIKKSFYKPKKAQNSKSSKNTLTCEEYLNLLLSAFDMIEAAHTTFAHCSGGQKKRVSVMVGLCDPNKRVICLKQPFDGLDSATSTHVMVYLTAWAKVMNIAMVIAMQQPSPHIFSLFHDIIVLENGEVLYHGPTCDIATYFTAMGFPCPKDTEIAAHILNVLTFPKRVLLDQFANLMDDEKSSSTPVIHIPVPHIDDQSLNNLQGISLRDHSAPKSNDAFLSSTNPSHHSLIGLNSSANISDLGDFIAYLPPSLHPLQTTYGLLYPSLCPCITINEMLQYYHASPFYQHILQQVKSVETWRVSHNLTPFMSHFGETLKTNRKKDIELITIPPSHYHRHTTDHTCIKHQHTQYLSILPNLSSASSHDQFLTPKPLITPSTAHLYPLSYALPLPRIIYTVLARQFKLQLRNHQLIISRLIPCLTQAILFGGLYFQIPLTDYVSRNASFVDIMVELAYNNLIELNIIISQRPVVHRQLRLFPVFIYVLATLLCSVPFALFEAFLLTIVSYFMIGHTPNLGCFIAIWLLLFLHGLVISTFFRCVSSLCPTVGSSYAVVSPLICVLYLCNGFYIKLSSLPKLLWWIYYISPFAWGLRSMALVEFSQSRYNFNLEGDVSARTTFLKLSEIYPDIAWVGYSVLYCFAAMGVLLVLASLFLYSPYKEYTRGTTRWIYHGDDGISIRYEYQHESDERSESIDEKSYNSRESQEQANTLQFRPMQTSSYSYQLSNTPITLSFRNISYFVRKEKISKESRITTTNQKQLLHNITGFALPGQCLAICGASGAGKTVLLNLLYNNNNCNISKTSSLSSKSSLTQAFGDIFVNNLKVPTPEQFSAMTGYVEQTTSLLPNETVREAILFSARMKLNLTRNDGLELTKDNNITNINNNNNNDHDNEAVIQRVVNEIVDVLELTPVQHTLCGSPQNPTLSPSQIKRVAIGIVLAQNRPLLLLDEATTSLDAQSAVTVVRTVKNIARLGKTVVMTIHQPQAELFFLFDALLLLGSGGFPLYFSRLGQRAQSMVEYFSSFSCIQPLPLNVNPADWLLQQITRPLPHKFYDTAEELYDQHYSQLTTKENPPPFSTLSPRQQMTQYLHISWLRSHLCAKTQHFQDTFINPQYSVNNINNNNNIPIHVDTTAFSIDNTNDKLSPQYIPLLKQFSYTLQRTSHLYRRDSTLFYTRLLSISILSIFFTFLYFDLRVTNFASFLTFASATVLTGANLVYMYNTTIVPIFCGMRATFYREMQSLYYYPFLWPVSFIVCEVVYLLPSTVLCFIFHYFAINGVASVQSILMYWIFNYIISLMWVSFGLMLSLIMPIQSFAEIGNNLFSSLCFSLAGVAIPITKMNVIYSSLARILPFLYFNHGLMITQFDSNHNRIQVDPSEYPKSVLERFNRPFNDTVTFPTARTFAAQYMGFSYSDLWFSLLWIAVMMMTFQTMAIIAAKFIRYNMNVR